MAEAGIGFMTFGISPYCEKARWALDWHRIRYREIGWPPGLHQILAKRCGAKSSALPILVEGNMLIQGSSAIIDWAERHAQDRGRSLAAENGAGEAREIERRGNEIIAVHVRRLAFAEMLPNYAHFVKPGMFERASGWYRLAGHMMWPVAVRVMMRGYDLCPGAAAESRAKIDAELDWLDSKLADGRSYLAGDRFSRVDLTVASALAAFARPKEMPTFHNMRAPEALAADVRRWSERPTMRWVLHQYRTHRSPAA
jgi:glutathione S-transferase